MSRTTRSGKLEALRSSVASKHDKLDIVLVDDIATDDLGPALEGSMLYWPKGISFALN